jgi:DNA-binding protein H-NS
LRDAGELTGPALRRPSVSAAEWAVNVGAARTGFEIRAIAIPFLVTHLTQTKVRNDGSHAMSKPDLNAMSLAELKALQKDVAAAIESYQERQKDAARAVLETKARELGFNLAELLPPGGRRKARAKSGPAKFRHPENPALTWTGRGRRPNWVTDFLGRGGKLEDLAA